MTTKLKRYKKTLSTAIVMVIILSGWLYRELRPTVIFHTPQESKYLGKVSEIDGCTEKLYVENHVARYRLPHVWNWKEVYLDEDGSYQSHTKTKY